MSRRFPSPHNAVTGSPSTPAMGVNSVNHLGQANLWLIRSAAGQLYTMDKDGQCKRQDETWFYNLLRRQHYAEAEK